MTKLASALPKGHANGLTHIADTIVDDPTATHVVVAVVDCNKLTTDTDTGDTEPTIRVLRVEPILDEADQETARVLMRRAAETRAPQDPLPDVDTEWVDAQHAGELGELPDDDDVVDGELVDR